MASAVNGNPQYPGPAKVKHASLESRRFFEKQKETLMSELLQASATQGSTIRNDGPRDPEPRTFAHQSIDC